VGQRPFRHLREQGVAVSERQVRQAAEQSGLSRLRAELVKRYHMTAESIRPRDERLTGQLLRRVEILLARLGNGGGLTPEEPPILVVRKSRKPRPKTVTPPELRFIQRVL